MTLNLSISDLRYIIQQYKLLIRSLKHQSWRINVQTKIMGKITEFIKSIKNKLSKRKDYQMILKIINKDFKNMAITILLLNRIKLYFNWQFFYYQKVFYCFQDNLLKLMLILAVVLCVIELFYTYLTDGFYKGTSVFIAVIIIFFVKSIAQCIQQQQARKFMSIVTINNVNVYRTGDLINISAYELMVGDIVIINQSLIIPVDGILLKGNLTVNQKFVSSQFYLINKAVPILYEHLYQNPFLYCGSQVIKGNGLMMVLCLGQNTFFHKYKTKTIKDNQIKNKTILELKIDSLIRETNQKDRKMAFIILVVIFIHIIQDCYKKDNIIDQLFSMQTIVAIIQQAILQMILNSNFTSQTLTMLRNLALINIISKVTDDQSLINELNQKWKLSKDQNKYVYREQILIKQLQVKFQKDVTRSLRIFLKYQLTSYFVVLGMIFIGSIFLGQFVLNSIQIIWIILFLPMLASFLPIQNPVQQQKNQINLQNQNLLTYDMQMQIIWQVLWQIVLLCIVIFQGSNLLEISGQKLQNNQITRIQSIFFNVLALLQIFNLINSRIRGFQQIQIINIFNNKILLIILGTIIYVQFLIVKYGSYYIRTVQLTANEHLLCLLLGSTSFVFELILRQIIKLNK